MTKRKPGRPSAASLAASAMAKKRWAGTTPAERSAFASQIAKAPRTKANAARDAARIATITGPQQAADPQPASHSSSMRKLKDQPFL